MYRRLTVQFLVSAIRPRSGHSRVPEDTGSCAQPATGVARPPRRRRLHAGTAPRRDGLASLAAKVAFLERAGSSRFAAMTALLGVGEYTLGFVLEHQARLAVPPSDAARNLPADPALTDDIAAAVRGVLGWSQDGPFEFGLALIIGGLELCRGNSA